MGRKDTALANLAKRKHKGGRPKGSEESPEKKAYRAWLKDYLEHGEAIVDFKKGKVKDPLKAFTIARDTVHGTPKQSIDVKATQTITFVDLSGTPRPASKKVQPDPLSLPMTEDED